MCLSFITAWRLRRQLRRPAPEQFRAFDDAGRLVLLAQSRELSSLLPGIQELADAGFKITLVVETHHSKEVLPATLPGCQPILRLSTSWWWNRPSRQFLASFDAHDGDVLIDASTTPSLPLLCLAVRSRASFKIGVAKGEENPFHLQILMPDSSGAGHPDGGASPAAGTPLDAGGLLKNALFYWKKIGVKENNL
ncbi:DUF6913 domain-containing protein [Barnesiella viscericola]|uniref:DUF6913 domain-containing protein n=1 Tax=Barnesiella viscericola TaxID=397865 RepID=UPI0024B73F78|nr:hypothetical protein [Barnesiella viscericola]